MSNATFLTAELPCAAIDLTTAGHVNPNHMTATHTVDLCDDSLTHAVFKVDDFFDWDWR